MSGWLTALGPAGTALALLVLGHVLGDFTFQTEAIARFEELKVRAFAEYFLVGTLTSVLVAMVLVALVSVLV